MTLVVAALGEEAEIVLEPARDVCRIDGAAGLRRARRDNQQFYVLTSGVGPEVAARRLVAVLKQVRPSLIIVIGYAGGLEDGLKLGDLAAIRRASLLKKLTPEAIAADDSTCEGSWELSASSHVAAIAASAGLSIRGCYGLTSHDVIGDPIHKSALHRKFGADVVDMETAALARVAHAEGIQAACVRAITDPADDDFLKPFSFQSRAARISTYAGSFARGKFFKNSREWRKRTQIARENLRRFLDAYFRAAAGGFGPDSHPG